MTATRATRHRAIYLRETIHSKLRLVRTLSDTRVYESYAPRSASTIGMTMTLYERRKILFLGVAHALELDKRGSSFWR